MSSTCVFYRTDSEDILSTLRMDPPHPGDTIVLPDHGIQEWLVEGRRFRPRADGGGPLVQREVVEVWVSLVT